MAAKQGLRASDARPLIWFGAAALLGMPARAADFSLPLYALNFAILCVVFCLALIAVRRMKRDHPLLEPTRLFALVGPLGILLFPLRSPGTPILMVLLIWAAFYFVVLGGVLAFKRLSR